MIAATDVLARVHARLGARSPDATLRGLTVGERALMVELDAEGRHVAGVVHRPEGRPPSPDVGTDAFALARESFVAERPIDRAVGLGAMNALSVPYVDWRRGDPMAALSTDVDCIATVGLFRPAFRKFGGVTVRVIERAPVVADSVAAPEGVTVETFTPGEARTAVEGVDVLFVTGSSLVYGGITDYLDAAADAGVPTTVLIGHSASFLPEPAFDAGATVVAGAHVADPDGVREAVAAGDCGTDLHEAGLEKVYVAASTKHPGLNLSETELVRQ